MIVLMASRLATGSDEAGALLAFRAGLGTIGSNVLASWNSSSSICRWDGVACSRGQQVVGLSLPSYGLTGTLSPSIGNLAFLQTLNLTSNWFQGQVPTSIGRLVHLQTLDPSYNSFSEYGEGYIVSTLGDVYSLGVLLLEIFTGRSPIDDMFQNSLDLHKFSVAALPNRAMEIADPTIWLHEEAKDLGAADVKILRSRREECLVSVIALGVSCSERNLSGIHESEH